MHLLGLTLLLSTAAKHVPGLAFRRGIAVTLIWTNQDADLIIIETVKFLKHNHVISLPCCALHSSFLVEVARLLLLVEAPMQALRQGFL